MTEIRPRHWIIAGAVAALLHASAFVLLGGWWDEGAKAEGKGGVNAAVTLIATRAGQEADSAEQAVTEVTAVAEVLEAPPPEAVTAATPPQPQPVEAVPPPAREPEVAIVPPKAKPVAKPETKPVAKPEPKPAVQPAAKPAPAQSAAEGAERREASRASVKSAGTQAQGALGQSPDVANAMGGGPVGQPSDDYISRLRYWLERNKTYPVDARRHRMQGIVHLYFRVTRDGRVLAHEIRQSTGFPLLDAEAEEMLKRAQPLPKFPDSMRGGYLDVVVPVVFSLRGNS